MKFSTLLIIVLVIAAIGYFGIDLSPAVGAVKSGVGQIIAACR
jgi:hypothetical protein